VSESKRALRETREDIERKQVRKEHSLPEEHIGRDM
jgi:hypothetical protein